MQDVLSPLKALLFGFYINRRREGDDKRAADILICGCGTV